MVGRVLVVVTVVGSSMVPALRRSDRVLALRFWPRSWIRRRQIVLVRGYGGAYGYKGLSIKRVIGLVGDRVVTHLDEVPARYRAQCRSEYDAEGRRVWIVPQGSVFLRADCPGGADSALWGPVPASQLAGRVVMKLPAVADDRKLWLAADRRLWTVPRRSLPLYGSGPGGTESAEQAANHAGVVLRKLLWSKTPTVDKAIHIARADSE